MILIGLIPKAGAIVAGIPHPVLGGAALAMFATVAVVGIQTLSRVDFHDHRNVVIVGHQRGPGDVRHRRSPTSPRRSRTGRRSSSAAGITLGSITAIVLNLVFHHIGKSRGPAVAGTPGDGLVRLDEVNKMSREEFVRHLRPACSRARTGWSSGPTTRGRSATPSDLRRAFQEALFSATADEQRPADRLLPRPRGGDAWPTGEEGEDSPADQSVARADPARREGARGAGRS